jgi:hypothetical protein
MVTPICALRSWNLRWALAETFATIDPTLTIEAKGTDKELMDYHV